MWKKYIYKKKDIQHTDNDKIIIEKKLIVINGKINIRGLKDILCK